MLQSLPIILFSNSQKPSLLFFQFLPIILKFRPIMLILCKQKMKPHTLPLFQNYARCSYIPIMPETYCAHSIPYQRGRKRGGGGGSCPPLFEEGGGHSPPHFFATNFLLSAMPLHRQMTLSVSIAKCIVCILNFVFTIDTQYEKKRFLIFSVFVPHFLSACYPSVYGYGEMNGVMTSSLWWWVGAGCCWSSNSPGRYMCQCVLALVGTCTSVYWPW